MTSVCVVTGTRAEYGLLAPVMRLLDADSGFELQLLVTGTHFSGRFGDTYRDIEADGFRIDARVPLPLDDDSPAGVAASMGAAVAGIGEALRTLAPDLVVLLGDRYETLAAASAAVLARIPVAHIHGGELTEGAVDDALRHAVTKMSVLHFTSAEGYRSRVIQMGEDPESVFAVGALGVDNALSLSLVPPATLEADLDFELGSRTVVATYHPVTTDADLGAAGMSALLDALDALPDVRVLFTLPNADPGNVALRVAAQRWCEQRPERALAVTSLGCERYLSAVASSGAVVGNSSSGIIEAPALGVPTVNVGDRQLGRIRPASVIDCPPDADAVRAAIERALSPEFRAAASGAPNPYGDGHAAERIVGVLRERAGSLSVRKRFVDLECTLPGRPE